MTENLNKRVVITFDPKQVVNQINSNGSTLDVIAFPKGTKFDGYTWLQTHEWIRQSKYQDGLVYTSISEDYMVKIKKYNNETKSIEDEKMITAEEVKRSMFPIQKRADKKKKVITFN